MSREICARDREAAAFASAVGVAAGVAPRSLDDSCRLVPEANDDAAVVAFVFVRLVLRENWRTSSVGPPSERCGCVSSDGGGGDGAAGIECESSLLRLARLSGSTPGGAEVRRWWCSTR